MSMMMRILYDEGGFIESHGGVSRYFTQVMQRVPVFGGECRLAISTTKNAYLKEVPFSISPYRDSVKEFADKYFFGKYPPKFRGIYKRLSRRFPRMVSSCEGDNIILLKSLLDGGEFDVLHATAPHLPGRTVLKYSGGKPIVVTVHDLIPELVQHCKKVMRARREMLDKATRVIAVSENTKNDILRLYGIPEEKIDVVYHGYILPEDGAEADEGVRRDFFGGEPYLLYVGKRSGYKNFAWFVKAVAPLLRDGLNLLCTGTPFEKEETDLLRGENVESRVKQTFLSDREMQLAYEGAVAFVYPSIYEGFGIPILDAFAHKCPVVLSRASCFPEVAKDAALYFELGDERGVCDCIRQLMGSGRVREEYVARGLRRVRDFSWDKCARETWEVYRKAVGA